MQVLGLGESPDDVAITGAVRSKAPGRNGNATINFWRAVENLSVTPTLDQHTNIWAVSQGTALRRVHVKGNLTFRMGAGPAAVSWRTVKLTARSIPAPSSNGFPETMTGAAGPAERGTWFLLAWSNPPAGTWPNPPYTVIAQTPLIREKPYLFIDSDGNYFVMVPNLETNGTRGITWSNGTTPGTPLPIDQFYLAHPEKDTAASINAALKQGKNLLLTPGIYHLENSIQISRPDTVVLGLGYPTLVPDQGTPAMVVSDVDGVKVGGILFQAGTNNSATLLQVGTPGSSASHATDPLFFYDIFCRVGGAAAGNATDMVTINCNDVVGDNFWLWRADHGRGVGWDLNKNVTGLTVNGDNVTLYGLFVEHCQGYQTLWNGNGGRVYFYQSEMPYDPPSQAAWRQGDVNGFASYKVADEVKTHEAWGLGVYSVFHASGIVADNAIETPTVPGVKMHHLVTLRLGWRRDSGIRHILNGTGGNVITNRQATLN